MMKRNNTAVLLTFAVIAGLLSSPLLGGCGGGNNTSNTNTNTTREAPTTLFGSWRLKSITGGITGGGQPVEKETIVTFNQNGTTTRREAGQVTFNGSYRVVGTSDWFGGNMPVLEYLPANSSTPYVITRSDSTRLTLSQEAADGFQYDYERVP